MTRTAAILLAFALAGCGCTSVPSHDDLRATNHRLKVETGMCSGTAVGPDLLVTALHCGEVQQVGNYVVTAEVVERGSRDFVVVRVKGVTFETWAKRGERPRQGDRVRWWGNPVGEPNVYREGYVARADGDVLVIAAQICKGDSGAGLFNDRGEVVGIISAMTAEMHCQFALSLP